MRCALKSHLLWAAWGVYQAKTSSIDFDYMHYSKGRMEGFMHSKRALQKKSSIAVDGASNC